MWYVEGKSRVFYLRRLVARLPSAGHDIHLAVSECFLRVCHLYHKSVRTEKRMSIRLTFVDARVWYGVG